MSQEVVVVQQFWQTATIDKITNNGGRIPFSPVHHHRYIRIQKAPQQCRLQKNSVPPHPQKPPRLRVASSTSRYSCNRRYSEATRRSERQADEAAFPNEEKRAANSRGRFAQRTELGHKRLDLLSLIPPIHPRWSRYTQSCLSAAYRW